ncbi:uncharacterized protein F4812DRAFT_423293 [Daldinia caldariorum]|uniref:uncharacterized protein n=1 Tax=Daldinia caldariorum TaxID=326644 RepID=UPI0020079E79|nr:uncharacterized protein F4812DRAFT_423293 [Daldinia caldariorum]KAI1469490.1 hypothetical protein F4812DRAFT_423293 [Daldinia caldariorum]
MCGNHARQSRGGALAVLSLPLRSTRFMAPVMAGQLTFHDCGNGGSIATHATFIPDEENTNSSLVDLDSYIVGIHETGDLTRSAIMSPFLHKFNMARTDSTLQSDQGRSIEVPLTHPMNIEVGGDGIIGRRVTLWLQGAVDPIAEGIIGYN